MTDYGGKIGEILHELSRFVAFSCRFRRCSDHRIARHGKVRDLIFTDRMNTIIVHSASERNVR